MDVSSKRQAMVEEAVETLFSYILNPFVRAFLRSQPEPRIPAQLDRERLRDEVTRALLGTHRKSHLELEELVAYLDRLQESGDQHVLLLSLPEERRGELQRLADPAEVRRRLEERGLEDRYDQNRFLFHARDGPLLAECRYEPDKRLHLKWVETRTWWKNLGTDIDATGGVEIARRERREERSVNFFDLDLVSGKAEIKVQRLHTRSLAARKEALERYRSLAAELIGCDAFLPLFVAPAIRRALAEARVSLYKVEVVLPEGGIWAGGKGDQCPAEPASLRAALTLGYVHPHEGKQVRVELDGRIDEVRILDPCAPQAIEAILAEVRAWYREGVSEEPSTPPEDGRTDVEGWGEQVLRRLKEALSPRRRGEPAPVSDRLLDAVQEYLASRPAELEGGRAAAGKGGAAPRDGGAPEPWRSPIELAQFLEIARKAADRERREHRREIAQLRSDERFDSWLGRAAALLALGIVAVGTVFIFARRTGVTAGVLSELIGLLTGGVSLLLRSSLNRARMRRADLEARERETADSLQAIQAALAVDDPRAMRKVADMLRERAMRAWSIPAAAPVRTSRLDEPETP